MYNIYIETNVSVYTKTILNVKLYWKEHCYIGILNRLLYTGLVNCGKPNSRITTAYTRKNQYLHLRIYVLQVAELIKFLLFVVSI